MLATLSINLRLAMVVVVGILGLAILGTVQALDLRSELQAEAEHRLDTVTAIALSIAEARHAEAEAGTLTMDEARSRAAEQISQLRYDGTNYLWINDLEGILIAHPHRGEQIGTSMLALTDVNGTEIYREFVAAARSGGGFVDYVGRRPDSEDMTSPKLARIELFEPWDWGIGTGSYIDDIDERFWSEARFLAKIALAIAVTCCALAFLVSRSISRGIAGMTATMRRLASGETDVTVPFLMVRNEIGLMAGAVDVFRKNAIEKAALEQAQHEAERRAAAEKKAEMDRLAGDFEGSVGQVVNSVSAAATELQASATSMSKTAEETSGQATTVAGSADQASANVQTVAAAAEELGASIGEISRQMTVQTDAAEEAASAASGSEDRIRDLAQKVEAIGSVVSLITGIAEQTNLLALNATIEAARAGDAGKGFAVVASEVKALANQTAKATEEIASQIKAVQDQTSDAVTAIAEIGGKIEKIKGVSATVAAAIEQQNAASAEIGRNIQEAATGTHHVSGAIGGVTAASVEAGHSAAAVRTAADDLSHQAVLLSEQVAGFMARVRAA